MLENNLLGLEMLFRNIKAEAKPWPFFFETTFLDLEGYSTTFKKTRTLFLKS